MSHAHKELWAGKPLLKTAASFIKGLRFKVKKNSQTFAELNQRWLIKRALLQCDAQEHMHRSVNPKLPPVHLLQDASTRTEHVLKTNNTTCTGVQTPSRELDTGIASDSCFLLCNCAQLLFLREGILVL